jgi:hypothetical protein
MDIVKDSMKRILLTLGLVCAAWPAAATNTPATGSLTLASAGVAQNFQNAGVSVFCVIKNPATATEQGIGTAEAIWVNVTGTAVAGGGGASISLEPDESQTVGWTGGLAISWVAATAGHKIEGYCQAAYQ